MTSDVIEEVFGDAESGHPFTTVAYHYGMLLGVGELETQATYHSGQQRLGNAWLHGDGVIWGYKVELVEESTELRVDPGLAMTNGLFLANEVTQCLDLGGWWERLTSPAPDPDASDWPMPEVDARSVPLNRGDDRHPCFDAVVVLRHATKLSRPVPVSSPSSTGEFTELEASRLRHRALPALLPMPLSDADSDRLVHEWVNRGYPLLRVLFGLRPPHTPEERTIVEQRERILALHRDDRPRRMVGLTQLCAARDATAQQPARDPQHNELSPYPAHPGRPDLAIARLRDVRLEQHRGDWRLVGGEVDIDRRPTILPTELLEELFSSALANSFFGHGPSGPTVAGYAPGPRTVTGSEGREGATMWFDVDEPLLASSVSAYAFEATVLLDDGWHEIDVVEAAYDQATNRVVVRLSEEPDESAPIRLIVRGTGRRPILGQNLLPFAGGYDSPPSRPDDGLDYVVFLRGTS